MNRHKKTVLSSALALALLSGLLGAPCLGARGAWEAVGDGESRGLGRVVTEEYNIRGFDQVEIGSAFEAEIRQGPSYRVVVRVDSDLVPYLRVRESWGTLSVSLQPGAGWRVQGSPLHVEISAPRLRRVELSGASQALVRGLRSDRPVSLALSGSSDLAGELSAPELLLEVSGASRVSLSGSCEELQMELSGASRAELTDLEVQRLDAELSGASTAAVDVEGRLDLEASGASRLFYSGHSTMGSIDLSGASSLKSLQP